MRVGGPLGRRPYNPRRALSSRSSCRSTSPWRSPSSFLRSSSRSRCGPTGRRPSRRAGSSGSCSGCRAAAALVVGVGLIVTGAFLIGSLGLQVVDQPWLVVALVIYAINLALAFFIQRPSLRALVGLRAAWDDRVWQAGARRQRYVSYAMAGLIGVIGYLMSAKPQL